jgi:hypothetical protein
MRENQRPSTKEITTRQWELELEQHTKVEKRLIRGMRDSCKVHGEEATVLGEILEPAGLVITLIKDS